MSVGSCVGQQNRLDELEGKATQNEYASEKCGQMMQPIMVNASFISRKDNFELKKNLDQYVCVDSINCFVKKK